MTKENIEELHRLSLASSKLNEASESDVISDHFITCMENESRTEVVLSGNRSGLLHMASLLLDLASKAQDMQHYHFDEHSNLTTYNKKLIIRYESAPWESKPEPIKP